MSADLLPKTKSKMDKSIDALLVELSKVRTGRASMNMLDDIRVDYYGTPTPLNGVAALSIPEPRMITIQPWDTNVIGLIEKAIQKSDLGFNPVNDGKMIRITIPQLTEERRKDLVKLVKKYGEDSRVGIRHGRRDAMDDLKKLEKDKAASEDEIKKLTDQVQKITDDYIKKIDEIIAKKEKDLLQV